MQNVCMIQLTLIYINPNECSHELLYYLLTVNLDRCAGSCHTLDDLLGGRCVPNETEDLNLSTFNVITGIYDSKN